MNRYLLACCVCAPIMAAQSFEAAAVKPHNPRAACEGANLLSGGRFVATCWPLRVMIQEAYDVLPNQISEGPGWIYSEPWDITAKAEGVAGEIPRAEFSLMLRALIRERFHVALREQTEMLPGLALVVARNGPKFSPNTNAPFEFDLTQGPALACKKVTMAQLASWLKSFTGAQRTVIDKTGLQGEFDFTLRWSAQPMRGADIQIPPTLDSSGPTIFTALQEQLGLRLESEKVPTSMFIIQAAERPIEN